MTFWRRKKRQVEQAVDDVAVTATDLAEKTMVIGPAGVLLLLGVAAAGAAAAYYVTQTHKKKKAAAMEVASSKPDKRS